MIDTREQENINIFLDCIASHHCQHLASDIDQYAKSIMDEVGDKNELKQKMVDILRFVADKEEITTEKIVGHL